MYYVKHSLERADGIALVAIYFILLKLALVVALALLFSCYTTPLLAILFTAGLYVSGLFVKEMRGLHSETMAPAVQTFLRWLSYLLPNFENFDVMAYAAHGRDVPAALIVQNTAYAALYCAIVLVAASAIFSQAKFEMKARNIGVVFALRRAGSGIRRDLAVAAKESTYNAMRSIKRKTTWCCDRGPMLKAISLEYAPLMADLYWTRVVQYYGVQARPPRWENFELLWPLLDVTTTLDPHLLGGFTASV